MENYLLDRGLKMVLAIFFKYKEEARNETDVKITCSRILFYNFPQTGGCSKGKVPNWKKI